MAVYFRRQILKQLLVMDESIILSHTLQNNAWQPIM